MQHLDYRLSPAGARRKVEHYVEAHAVSADGDLFWLSSEGECNHTGLVCRQGQLRRVEGGEALYAPVFVPSDKTDRLLCLVGDAVVAESKDGFLLEVVEGPPHLVLKDLATSEEVATAVGGFWDPIGSSERNNEVLICAPGFPLALGAFKLDVGVRGRLGALAS